MEKKEFLTEENYEKSKKKIKKIALIILIAGILLGTGLITTGLILSNNTKKTNEKNYNKVYKQVEQKKVQDQQRLDEIKKEKEELNAKIDEKETECDSIEHGSNWFANVNKCERESSSLNSQLSDLEMEEFNLSNTVYPVLYNKISTAKYVPLYVFGGFIILVSGIVSLGIYLFSKRREMLAFGVQQVMPIAQEGMEKMAPTVGKVGATIGKEVAPAIGDIAKSISKGIQEGKNESNDNKGESE